MNTRTFPVVTTSLLLLIAAIHAVAPDKTLFYFGAGEIAQGQTWRLFTGHLAHADWSHLLWNALGLAILGWLIERHSRRLLLAALAAGIIAVSGLLLSPFSTLDYYCGLSGVLNALLVIALWLEWRDSRAWWVAAIALACFLKVLVEISSGQSIITQISWPPFAWSHLAGMAGGMAILIAQKYRTQTW